MTVRYERRLTLGLAAALVLMPAFTACSRNSTPSQVQADGAVRGGGTAGLRGFTKVAATGSDNVEISVGPNFSVRATGSKAVLDSLRFDVDGDTLKVRRENSPFFSYSSATIHISLPSLTGASTAGSGGIKIDGLTGSKVALSVKGSGNISAASIAVDALDVSVSGSGSYDLAGTARQANVSVAGSGTVEADRLKVDHADISVRGSGSASLASDGEVSVNLRGSGNVHVKGKARCKKLNVGSGEVTCG